MGNFESKMVKMSSLVVSQVVVWGKDSLTVDQQCSLTHGSHAATVWHHDQWLCIINHTDSTMNAIEPFNKTLWEKVL